MDNHAAVRNGLYRLIKWEEDENPVFTSRDTVVEVSGDWVIHCTTHRRWSLRALGCERSLFGPIRNPYDTTGLRRLGRIDLVRAQEYALLRSGFHAPEAS